MTTYEAIDDVIATWASRHGLKLNAQFDGQPRRFCYVSAGEDECFQVSIEPPEGEAITVNAWDVETRDDAEFHRAWQIHRNELASTLDAALEQITEWSARSQSR